MQLKWTFIIAILIGVMFFQACPPPSGCGFNGNEDEKVQEEGEYEPYDNDNNSCDLFSGCFDITYECILLAGDLDGIDICIEQGLQCLIKSDNCTSIFINCTIDCENLPLNQMDKCIFDCSTGYLGCIANCGWNVICFFDCVDGVDECMFDCDVLDWSCIHGCYKTQYDHCSGKCF